MTREPTEDQLLAMRYADGEREGDARAAFERRLADDEALRREVSALRRLEVLARQVAPPEPGDLVLRHLERGWGHRLLGWIGWTLVCGASLGLLVHAVLALLDPDRADPGGELPLALGAGLALLLLRVLRERLQRLPHDPYRSVHR